MLLEIKLNSFNHTEDVQEDIVINLQILGTRLVSYSSQLATLIG